MILVDSITAPAAWACYLVYQDEGDLTEEELDAADALRARLAPARVVDIARDEDGNPDEPRFTWSFALFGGLAQGGDVLDYVTHRPCD